MALSHQYYSVNLGEKSYPSTGKLYAITLDFPAYPVVENPPTNTGDTSSIPALGRFRMLKAKAVVLPLLKRKCWGKALKILAHIKTSLWSSQNVSYLYLWYNPKPSISCECSTDSMLRNGALPPVSLGQSWLEGAVIPFYRGKCWGCWIEGDPPTITDWRGATFFSFTPSNKTLS